FADVFPMRYSYVADHFQYLASLAPIALAAVVLRRFARRPRRAVVVCAGALVVTLAALTWRRCGAFRDEEALWRDTLAKNPDAFMAHNNLAILLAGAGNLPEAAEHFRRSLELKPDYASALNLGIVLEREGEREQALELYRESLRLKPDEVGTHLLIGRAL